jgi:hypothetical protein
MIVLGAEQTVVSLRIATIVVPVALYFLLLGLLNTRRCPQFLSGRQDFAMLMVALSPLALGPIMYYFDGGAVTLLIGAIVLAGGIFYLAPRGRTWVIYNLTLDDGCRAILDVLDDMGKTARQAGSRIEIGDSRAVIEISSFPVLRNISLKFIGGNEDFWRDFEARLAGRLERLEVEPSPMAVTLLLVATAMIVAPTALMVHHAPEIVRILTDLLP